MVIWLQLFYELDFITDAGIDLNAKYAIMCRKTVLIPENDKELTYSGIR